MINKVDKSVNRLYVSTIEYYSDLQKDNKNLYKKYVYVTTTDIQNALLEMKELTKPKEIDSITNYTEFTSSYTIPIDITKIVKFIPQESNGRNFYFCLNGKKYKFEYVDWDFYNIIDCESGEEIDSEYFPDNSFCRIGMLSDDYSIYDLEDGYYLYAGEYPYSDFFTYLIFNIDTDYVISNDTIYVDNIKELKEYVLSKLNN